MNENITSNTSVSAPAEPAVLNDPLRNRGVAFTRAEREALGLTGRLPSGVLTLEEQTRRAYAQLQAQGDDLAKNVYMEQLHDRNEVLYYRVLLDHLAELLPSSTTPRSGTRLSGIRTSTAVRGGSTCPSTGLTTSRRRSARWAWGQMTWT
jgi:malate dehydrogenase (oxaloacetate-decarboxylating)